MLPAMDALLKLLRENAALSAGDLAGMLELSEDDVRDKIRQAQADGDILGYQAILSDESNGAGARSFEGAVSSGGGERPDVTS